MDAPESTSDFYEYLPVFRDFTQVADEACFAPMPDDWVVGVADVQQSTEGHSPEPLQGREHGGRGGDRLGRQCAEEPRLPLRLRRRRRELCGAACRCRPRPASAGGDRDLGQGRPRSQTCGSEWFRSPTSARKAATFASRDTFRRDTISIAMFSGGGMAWADAAMKRGEIALPPAPPGSHPDLSGLSCRYELIPSQRGQVLSLVVVPGPDARGDDFRAVVEAVTRIVEKTPDASRPLTGAGLRLKWPPQGYDLEARASRRAGESIRARKAQGAGGDVSLLPHHAELVCQSAASCLRSTRSSSSRIRISASSTIRCAWCSIARRNWSAEIENYLKSAAAKGVVRYGMHRQDAAMMTCFTPSPINPKHVHFIDGAQGGYALAAAALKESSTLRPSLSRGRARRSRPGFCPATRSHPERDAHPR